MVRAPKCVVTARQGLVSPVQQGIGRGKELFIERGRDSRVFAMSSMPPFSCHGETRMIACCCCHVVMIWCPIARVVAAWFHSMLVYKPQNSAELSCRERVYDLLE